MNYTISTEKIKYIKPMPESIVEEVIQNINMILSTAMYSCPLYRDFGIAPSFLDKPEPIAKNLIVGEIYDKIALYEPRAEVESVTFKQSKKPGEILPIVEVKIKNA